MRSGWRRFLTFVSLLCLAALAGLYLLSPVLSAWLVVSDPLKKADAIVVLGGSFERSLHAYELYRDGFAPRLLLSGQQVHGFEIDGRPFTEAFFSQLILRGLGVPDRAMILLESGTSTYAESVGAAAISKQHGWRRLILVSSPYHMRRARLTFRKQLRGQQVELVMRPARQSWFAPGRSLNYGWIRTVLHEYLGMIYYRWKGRL